MNTTTILSQVDTEYVTGNKALYRVHCLTFAMAKEIFGYSKDCNLATSGNHPLATFRAYPPYRRSGAKSLRAKVLLQLRLNALKAMCGPEQCILTDAEIEARKKFSQLKTAQ